MKKLVFGIVLCIGIAGCGLLPITDGQIDDMSAGAGSITKTLIAPIANSFLPGTGEVASGGVGGVISVLVYLALKSLQKKNENTFEKKVKSIVKKK